MERLNVTFHSMREIMHAHECRTQKYIHNGEHLTDNGEQIFALVYILEGNWEFIINGELCRLKPNSCFVIMPYMTLSGKSVGTGEHSYLTIQTRNLFESDEDNEGFTYNIPHVVNRVMSSEVKNLMKSAIYYNIIDDKLSAFGYFLQALEVYSKLDDNINEDDYKIIYVQKITDYITENYKKPITLNDIASNTGISAAYCCKIFKLINKISIINYINQFRIKQAKEQMLYTKRSLKEIAQNVGFNNYTYFCRIFKTSENMSPNEFRKNYNSRYGYEVAKVKRPYDVLLIDGSIHETVTTVWERRHDSKKQ